MCQSPANTPQSAPLRWYIAVVRNNTEIASSERLAQQGIESFAATQKVWRVWRNGRRKLIDHVVLRGLLFIRCTESTRRQIVKLPYINRFMVDRAATRPEGAASRPVAQVSPREIGILRFMLGQSDLPVEIVDMRFAPGDKVKVVRGPLKNLEGEIIRTPDADKTVPTASLIVRLDLLGAARVDIPAQDLSLIRD